MKFNKIIYAFASLLLMTASCKDDFLAEKRDMSGFNEDVFEDPLKAQAYVDYIYGLFLPANNAQSFVISQGASANGTYNTSFTQTTEELAGETNWNKEWPQISYLNAHANEYFGQRMPTGIANNTWTRMKQINLFLSEIDKHGLDENTTKALKGQMYFWRAWQYFELLKQYGGVPIVLTPQDPIVSSGADTQVPRSTSSQTLEQIISDLDMAISLLPAKWSSSGDWGRINGCAAAAFKGRVLLTWASPLFNRNDDVLRWERSYNANLAAYTLLKQNSYDLYKVGGTANAEAWGNMWSLEVNNPEAIIVYGFNNLSSGNTMKNSGWEQAIRPKEVNGGGSISPTKQMVDAFPMKDGKMPGSSTYAYDTKKFYKNRDPRFYKTFAYNGSIWPFSGNTSYKVWTYVWKKTATASSYNATTETKGANSSGIYLRKGSVANASNSLGNFNQSGTDFIELRFAEVVLNLAESAIGFNKLTDGLDGIKSIRERAGVENLDGNYGLSDAVGDRNKLFAAVLNERKIEFAYENKRFWDLRRWLLFDDTYGTVSRLGMQPLNGMRRTGYTISVKNNAGTDYIESTNGTSVKDPLIKNPATGTAFVIDRDATTYPAGITTYDQYLDYLYDNYFVVSVKDDLDKTNPANWTFKWYPQYYFFGFHSNILSGSPYLEQTKDWDSLNGAGTFDPLK